MGTSEKELPRPCFGAHKRRIRIFLAKKGKPLGKVMQLKRIPEKSKSTSEKGGQSRKKLTPTLNQAAELMAGTS